MNEPTTEPREVGITHPANLLTLTRLVFAPLLFWFVLDADANRGASWAAFGLGIALAVTDFFDGRVARRSNVVSRSGAFLDPLADKIVVIGAAFSFVAVDPDRAGLFLRRYGAFPVSSSPHPFIFLVSSSGSIFIINTPASPGWPS